MNSKIFLSEKEITLLDLLWTSNKPLTSVDMLKNLDATVWNDTNLFRTIKSLLRKELIRVCGRERYNTQYARIFEPAISREEYAAQFLNDRGLGKSSIVKLAMALVSFKEPNADESDTEEDARLIEELEAVIDKLRERGC